jgi:hypothetical protein
MRFGNSLEVPRRGVAIFSEAAAAREDKGETKNKGYNPATHFPLLIHWNRSEVYALHQQRPSRFSDERPIKTLPSSVRSLRREFMQAYRADSVITRAGMGRVLVRHTVVNV